MWLQTSPIVQTHKALTNECATVLARALNVFGLFDLWRDKPHILPFIENLRCCPKRRRFPEIIAHIENALSKGGNRGFGMLLRDLLNTQDVLTQLGNCEPLEVLAYILPYIPSLQSLEFMAPYTTSGFLPITMSTLSFQHLSFLRIYGEDQYPRVHVSWYHLALTIPSLQTFHGHLIGMDGRAVGLDWPSTLNLIGPSSIKNLFLTQSALKAWEFAVSRVETLETFLYNYVEFREESNGHNPAGIVTRLPRSIKHLAILESDMKYLRTRLGENVWGGRRIDSLQSVSFSPFRHLEIIWCSWALLVPKDKRNFDLSKVLPCSLDWLVLYCVPTTELGVLISAMPRLPRLEGLWVQIHCFTDGGEHVKDEDEVVACMERLQYEMQKNCVVWCQLNVPSPFQPYIRYLDVHDDRPKLPVRSLQMDKG